MAVAGTLALMMICIIVGKSFRRLRPLSYGIVAVIAVILVAIVFYVMFTMLPPEG